ncbi:MAG: hypothetical protein PVG49_02910 [Desulfobacteraceae bacterium]|jgi:hypothetical protein
MLTPNPSEDRTHQEIRGKILELYAELFRHEGFGELSIRMRFVKRNKKEVVIQCGKEYRFVVDYP